MRNLREHALTVVGGPGSVPLVYRSEEIESAVVLTHTSNYQVYTRNINQLFTIK